MGQINNRLGNTLLESGFYPPCRAATIGSNITLSGLQTIDGVVLIAGDRVLVKDQTSSTTNGIYAASTGNWPRTTDALSNTQFFNGMGVIVAQGAVNGGLTYLCTSTDDPVVIGASLLTFASQSAVANLLQSGTSTTSAALSTGAKTFVTQAGKNFNAKQWVLIYETSNPDNNLLAEITSYSGTSLVVSVIATAGSGGPFTDWSIVLTSSPPSVGRQPPIGSGIYTLPLTGAVARTMQARFGDIPSILDFGADPTGVIDATTAIQNAVNGCAHGILEWAPGSFNATGPITISSPIKIRGGNFIANLTCTSTSNDLFVVNSSYVTIEGLYLNRAGTPTAGRAIAIGTDYRAITDAQVTNGSFNLTSPSQAIFTSADIGKTVYFQGAAAAGQPLFTSIASITSPTVAVMAAAAGTTILAAGHCQYGFNYQEIVIRDVQMFNHFVCLHVLASTQLHIDHIYALGASPMIHENRLWSDQGDSFLTNSTLISNDFVSGIGLTYKSGGGLKIIGNKILEGRYGIQVVNENQTTIGPQIIGNSIESMTVTAVYFACTQTMVKCPIVGNYLSSGTGPALQFDSGASVVCSDVTITGNTIGSGGAVGVDLGKITFFTVGDNVVDMSGVGTAYAIRSNAVSGKVSTGQTNAAVVISNDSTTTVIDCPTGDTFANMPGQAANGSRFFVSNGTAASSPLTGGGTGSTAFRQNGAWKGI